MSELHALTGETPGGFTPRKPDPFRWILWTQLAAVFGWGGAWYIVSHEAPEFAPLTLHCGICLLLILTASARFAAARANLTARRALEGAELEKKDRGKQWAETLALVDRSEQRTDNRMRELEDSANRSLASISGNLAHQVARFDCIELGGEKRCRSLEQRLDATIEHQDKMEQMWTALAPDRRLCRLERNLAGGAPVPYSNGACRDAADADGAVFDALELVALGQTSVPEHIDEGDKVIWWRQLSGPFGSSGQKLTTGTVIKTTHATVVVAYIDKKIHLLNDQITTISRDDILAHSPKEA